MPRLSMSAYARTLRVRGLRRVLVLGVILRAPTFAAAVVLTVHCVVHLGVSYTQAGVLTAAATLATTISGPWRGHLVDQYGLRKVVLPSVLATAACWSIAPFVAFGPLLVLAVIAGLLAIPTHAIIRQAVMAAVSENDRRSALTVDTALVEVAFIGLPMVAVWMGVHWGTPMALVTLQGVVVLAGLLLWSLNPPLQEPQPSASQESVSPRGRWLGRRFALVCLATLAVTTLLSGTDLAIFASVRAFNDVGRLGIVLGIWAAGSLVGGLIYGALDRPVPLFALLACLALATAPLAFARSLPVLAVLAFVAGLFCGPSVTASIDSAARRAPADRQGEAMGWHGAALTAGGTLGPLLAGVIIDSASWQDAFIALAVVGILVAVLVGPGQGERAVRRSTHTRLTPAA